MELYWLCLRFYWRYVFIEGGLLHLRLVFISLLLALRGIHITAYQSRIGVTIVEIDILIFFFRSFPTEGHHISFGRTRKPRGQGRYPKYQKHHFITFRIIRQRCMVDRIN
ncbi:uncharacterized protein F4807DRAFT_212703 [Annulohypoxylon truncatum]|uniref:uncharacterized protein n=1 Tax=Annulohypoxylon truncatum TaxID=327061 RepID=UPI002007B036|nr:uncharacterized protein F4807DRAFT_212703 [Annulohypoxylon truncatum]KAI1207059.1 hypothetical protein F4807DRAFT_212703 [Annulohypoxylon truncatum]